MKAFPEPPGRPDVTWERTLTVCVRRWTGSEDLRDYVEVFKENDGIAIVLDEKRYVFSNEVIEAIYDMHQDIPR